MLCSSASFGSLESSDHRFFVFIRAINESWMVLLSSDSFVGAFDSSDFLFFSESRTVLLSSDSLFLGFNFEPIMVSLSVLLITTSLQSISESIDLRFNGSFSGIVVEGVAAVVIVCTNDGALSGVGVDGVVAVVIVCIIDGG